MIWIDITFLITLRKLWHSCLGKQQHTGYPSKLFAYVMAINNGTISITSVLKFAQNSITPLKHP